MNRFLAIILLLSMLGCSKLGPNEALKTGDFSFTIVFHPAFAPSSRMEISRKDTVGKLKLAVLNNDNGTYSILMQDSVRLGRTDFDDFFDALGKADLLTMKTFDRRGLDGIRVKNYVSHPGRSNEFYYWSPSKDSIHYQIPVAVIALASRKFQGGEYVQYLESLEGYFHFRFPCKIIKLNPLEIRVYDVFYERDEQDVIQLITSLPSDKPVLMDMRNFQGMAQSLFPLFRSLIARNDSILWVPNRTEDLIEIGIDSSHIVKDIEVARNMLR